ncbi:MAG TPA: helix-turn-helix domain-containing protein [Actinomycetota bacterium]|jgi:DNA-binding transcriptional regulator YiaG|nr:helix-turn-helix domain-containing protein [Actinomycetota bacterium]
MTTKRLLELAKVRELAVSGEAKRLREKVGHLSLAEVADLCGVSPVSVWRWEQGEKRPHGTPAIRFLRLLEQLRDQEGLYV